MTITVEDLGNKLGRDLSEDDAAALAVAGSIEAVRTITDQQLELVEDDVIRLDGTDTDAIMLPELPVNEITSIALRTGTDTWDDLDPEDDFALYENGVVTRRSLRWPQGRQNIEVIYSHGWSEDDTPADLKLVMLTYAERSYSQGIAQFKSLGAWSVRYFQSATDFTGGELAILRKYTRKQQPWAVVSSS